MTGGNAYPSAFEGLRRALISSMSKLRFRSREWWSGPEYYNFARRAWLRAEGFAPDNFQNKPVIGICNSWSELNNCNAHLRTVAEAVKRGVWAAGGFPLEFPTISLGEMFMRPTTMLYRNLMAMDVEESIRANPIDGVVLLCGCDKTTPAQLMGCASADIPAIVVTGGPMLSGQWRGKQARRRHRWPQTVRPLPHRTAERRRALRDRGRHRAQRRALHGDGHRSHHDQPGRSAGHDADRLRQHSSARFAPPDASPS